MLISILELLAMLAVILVAAELFTNALECLGEKLAISEGVTGALFAAVGTALPETMVPLLALLAGTRHKAMNEAIGTGAILGAPFMLSTLAVFLMAISVLKKRRMGGFIKPEASGFKRDLHFFIAAALLSAAALFVPPGLGWLKILIALSLVAGYGYYVRLTLKASPGLVEAGHNTQAHQPLFLCKLGLPERLASCMGQIGVGLVLLLGGVKGFIYGVEQVAGFFNLSPLVLSLIIIPVATEMPEKINSILWLRRGKDTLALANITGAMVFQGMLLPALGMVLTPWQARPEVLACLGITLLASLWLRCQLRPAGLPLRGLLLNGLFYGGFMAVMLLR